MHVLSHGHCIHPSANPDLCVQRLGEGQNAAGSAPLLRCCSGQPSAHWHSPSNSVISTMVHCCSTHSSGQLLGALAKHQALLFPCGICTAITNDFVKQGRGGQRITGTGAAALHACGFLVDPVVILVAVASTVEQTPPSPPSLPLPCPFIQRFRNCICSGTCLP